ncbi:MAG: hypothetical protein IKC32_04695 [Clostridia bacterium]|nr:hypothetical protein [Clostridia bacterium]
MNMMFMLGIMATVYFASLVLLCFYHGKMNPKLINLAFIIADIVFFFSWNYAEFERGALGDGWMTLDNISPLVCTLIPLTLLMSDKVKSYLYPMIAFLSVGMFVAMLLSPEEAYLVSFKLEANLLYTSEAACHMICSLFGIYLILSGQVEASFKNLAKSLIAVYSLIGTGVVLNYVFHRSYFGMDPYGTSKIYMIDIFGSHIATLTAYILGVFLVLAIGMQAMGILKRVVDKLDQSVGEAATESASEAVTEKINEENDN